ncbi:MAG: hypothetical protein ACOCRX_00960 [Candidatus Woesearchaeota archaeon]
MTLYCGIKESNVKELVKFLKEKNLWLKGKKVIKKNDKKFFPVQEKFDFDNVIFKEFEIKDRRDISLPSYDSIGEIAIVEDREDIDIKEEAEKILKVNKNIKRVYKKSGIHDTEFRIQPIEFVKGDEDNTITDYKENKTQLKLDVAKTYFSPRLGTERRKIYDQIEEDEKVLVQFSGVGPYIYQIANNSNAKFVYGIELNPNAYKYSYENKFLNKAQNTLPIFGDVREIMKEFPKHLFGLKSSIDKNQLSKRLNKNYSIHEIHLYYDDLFSESEDIENRGKKFKETHNIINLKNKINELKNKNKNVFLHMPIRKKGKLINDVKDYLEVLNKLGKLAKKYFVGVIVHIHDDEMIEFILNRFKKYKSYFYYETLMESFSDSKVILNYKNLIENVCVDVSHLALNTRSNKKLKDEIKTLYNNFNLYYHISNTSFNDKSKEGDLISNGDIKLKEISNYFTYGIVEVRNGDENDPKEMIKSHNEIEEIFNNKRFFDRIIMPLPKDANLFLDSVLPYIKNNGVVHLYDFLNEEDIPQGTIEKFDEYAKKYDLDYECLEVRKTGQYAPGKYRVCGDFKILN